MDRNKIANLVQSISLSCKEVVKSNPFAQKLASPAVTLVALTILDIVVKTNLDPKSHWGA